MKHAKLTIGFLMVCAGLFAAGPALAQTYTNAVLADGPLAYYRLDETNGYDAIDSADAAGAPQQGAQAGKWVQIFVTPRDRRGAYLAGLPSNTCAFLVGGAITNSLAGLINDDYTTEFWVRKKVLQGTVPGALSLHYLFSRGGGAGGAEHIGINDTYTGGLFPGHLYEWFIWAGNGTAYFTPAQLNPNEFEWYHVAFTRSGSAIALYINGSQVLATNATLSASLSTAFTWGRRGTDGNWTLYGDFDEIAVYPNALSAAQIYAHYTNKLDMTLARTASRYATEVLKDNPLAYYRLQESSGSLVALDWADTASPSAQQGAQVADAYNATFGSSGALTNDSANLAAQLNGATAYLERDFGAQLSTNLYSAEFCFYNTRADNAATINGCLFSRSGTPKDMIQINGSYNSGTYSGHQNELMYDTNGAATALTPPLNPEESRWYHVVLTRSNTEVKIYVNGEVRCVTTNSAYATASLTTPTAGFVRWGWRTDSKWPVLGRMDELAVYNSVLTPERIAAHYLWAVTPVPQGAVFAFR